MTEWCCKPDCPGRHPACHDQCEKYREWRGRLKTEKEYTKNACILSDKSTGFRRLLPTACVGSGTSSSNVFHEPQEGHLPFHLALS